jgi:replicative DNA helicase
MSYAVRTGLACPLCKSKDNGVIYKNKDEKTGEYFLLYRCFGAACNVMKKLNTDNPDDYVSALTGAKMEQHEKQITGLVAAGSYQELKSPEHPWGDRKINEDICEYFGVSINPDTPLTQNRTQMLELMSAGHPTKGIGLVFPYYDDAGNCIAQKVRTAINKKGSWYKADDNALKRSGFFGQQLWKSNSIKDIIITFGELDALAVYQMIGQPVVSVNNGDGSAPALFKAQYNWLQRFNNIILIPDSDESCQAVIPLLGGIFPRKIRIVNLVDYKDPNDYLKNGAREAFVAAYYASQPFSPEKIISLGSLSSLLFTDPPKPIAMYPWEGLNKMTGGVWPGDLVTCKAPPKVGKCFGKGTEIRKYDGALVRVEDIVVGDILMGDDSTPREVTGIASGIDYMYRVDQSRGISYVVNSEHILSLVHHTTGEFVDIPIGTYMNKSNTFRQQHSGYKVACDPVNWPRVDNPELPPYLLGVWLGDGHITDSVITTGDEEIFPYIQHYAEVNGMVVSKRGPYSYFVRSKNKKHNTMRRALRQNKVIGDKHIPQKYKAAAMQDRMNLLAGIIDTDGYVARRYIEIVQRDKRLADDIVELANLCGFHTKVYYTVRTNYRAQLGRDVQCAYYRIFLRGDLDKIPSRVTHKKALEFSRARNLMRSKLEITPLGKDMYYGFTLADDSPNRRVLLKDGTVVHNTTFFTEIASHLYNTTTKPIGLIYLEETQRDLVFRFVSLKLNKNLQRKEVLANTNKEELETAAMEIMKDDRIFVVDHWGSCSSDFLEEKIKEFVLAKGCQFIFFDHISMAITDEANKDERLALDRLIAAIKALSIGIPDEESYMDEKGEVRTKIVTRQPTIFMITHVNDAGQPRGSRASIHLSNLLIGLQRDKLSSDAVEKNMLRVVVEDNRRYGETGLACTLNYNSMTGRLTEIPVIEGHSDD